MTDTRHRVSVFYVGQRSFRSRRTMVTILLRFAVAAAAFLTILVVLAMRPPLAGYLVGMLTIGGTVALAAAVSLSTAYALARIDKLVITERGVRYGDRFWSWGRVRAFRARRSRLSHAICLILWVANDTGRGKFLAIDEPVTSELAGALIGHVRDHCLANELHVACEASC